MNIVLPVAENPSPTESSSRPAHTRSRPRAGVFSLAALCAVAAACSLTGCESEPVGSSKTTTKQTIDSPTAKTTVTETKEKTTTINPR